MTARLTGVIPPMTTPFGKDGEIDFKLVSPQMEWLIGAGIHGVAVGGSTGEGHTLDHEEYRDLIAATVDAANGRIPVIAGIIVDSTRDAIRRGKLVRSLNVAALQVTPVHYLFRPNDDTMVEHFHRIAGETGMPIIIYNVVPWSYLSPSLLTRILAVRDVNESGGINGQKLTLVIADDAGCDPKMAVEVANELARQGIVFVDGHYCSSASIPASQVYHDKGVLMISPASTNPRLTYQGFANVFRVCGRDDEQGAFAADYVVDHNLADRIAIVHDQSAYGKGIADEFQRRLNERGVWETMYEAIAQGDNEFSELIKKMKAVGIDLIYFGGYFTESGLFVRQARGYGLTATMMVTSGSFNQEYWDLAGSAAEGTLMTFGPEPRKLATAVEVVKRFEAEGFSPEGYTLYAYAAIQVFAAAARRAASFGLDALEKALHDGTYETVLGPITFDGKGDVQGFKYSMYRWHDRTYEEVCCRPPAK